jgi:hypothetical protein
LRFLMRPLQALSLRTLLTRGALQEGSRYRPRLPLELIRSFHRQLRALTWLTTGSIAHRRLCCRAIPLRAVRVLPFSNYCPKRKHFSQSAVITSNQRGRDFPGKAKKCSGRKYSDELSPERPRWPLPPLRPKRAAYGIAGLRYGSGQRDTAHALMTGASASEPQPEAIPLNI